MRTFGKYKDRYSLIVTSEGDGGDTSFWMGHYYTALYLNHANMRASNRTEFDHVLKKLDVPGEPGNYRRHPDKAKWYSDPDRMSRDQMTALLIAMGFYKLNTRLKDALHRWLKRGMFMTNTRRNHATPNGTNGKSYSWKLPDWSPTFGGVFIRAFGNKYLYPLLFIYDLELLLSALKATFAASKSGDDLNYLARTVQAREVLPTPISYLARLIYKYGRQWMQYPSPGYEAINGPQSAIIYYCSRGGWKYPPMDLVWKTTLDTL